VKKLFGNTQDPAVNFYNILPRIKPE